jgi:PAS domain S-box-containing protein
MSPPHVAHRLPVAPAVVEQARAASASSAAREGFDATCVWVLGDDAPGIVVEWPASAERLYGVAGTEVVGQSRATVGAATPVRERWPEVIRALRRDGRWAGELVHDEAPGGRLFTDARLVVVPPPEEAGGEPLVVEIARDVSAHRVAEEALEASEHRLSAVIASARDAIVTVDDGNHVVLFNAAAERLFAVTAADALGGPVDRFLPDGVALDCAPGCAHRTSGAVRACRADGTEFPAEVAVSQVEAPGGRLRTVIVRDVSAWTRAEAERAALLRALEAERARLAEVAAAAEAARAEAVAARREAEAASHAKSAFLATMSHELRQPINAVLGYAELLDFGMAGPLSESHRRYLERIAGNGRQLRGLVEDVLDLSRIEVGEMTVARHRGGVRAAVRTALAAVRAEAGARGIEVSAPPSDTPDADDALAAYVGDEARVRQILVNLLSNAIKFTEPGGRVSVAGAVTAERHGMDGEALPGPWVALRVSDTGVGIPRDHHELVFARFQQVDREAAGPYRRTHGGSGLGLAISRELARLMGGDLTVESEPGRGSTFTLWLPAADPARDASGGGSSTSTAAGGRALEGPAVGPVLGHATRRVIDAWVERLRADPLVPLARGLSSVELEDHMAGFLVDLAQQFVILDDAGPSGARRLVLVRDGAEVRYVISRRHGVQRARLGWDEAALAREFTLLGEELERVLVTCLADVPAGAVDDARTLVRTWIADAALESLAALRSAAGEPPA